MKQNSTQIKKSSGNVFKDLGLSSPEDRLAKAALASQINHIFKERKTTQKEAAALLGVDQPKVSALSRGSLSGFSIERLIKFLNLLENDVEIVIKERPASASKHYNPGHLSVLRQVSI